jgi:anti-sigma28 factor (negative regulator of flagellin synthesis)
MQAPDDRARVERIATLRQQVRDGVYDSVSTLDAVARRILQSGDL